MPAFYAHDRFGKEVSARLNGELKEIVKDITDNSESVSRDQISFSFTVRTFLIRFQNTVIIFMPFQHIRFLNTQ